MREKQERLQAGGGAFWWLFLQVVRGANPVEKKSDFLEATRERLEGPGEEGGCRADKGKDQRALVLGEILDICCGRKAFSGTFIVVFPIELLLVYSFVQFLLIFG